MSSTRATAEEVLKRVRRIEIATRRVIDSMMSGQYHTRFKGQGMQFSDFREYYAGDDIRHIDWKVTARTQSAHIKKFEEERDLTVYLLVDVSKSNQFGSFEKLKEDVIAEVAALLAFSAVKNNDRVGLILFSDRIEKHVPPKKGRSHAMRLISEILSFKPVSAGTNLKMALEYYSQVVKHTGVVFLATDFLSEQMNVTDLEKDLRRVSRKHDVIALRARDRREVEVPQLGKFEFVDAESGLLYWADTKSHSFQSQLEKNTKEYDEKLTASLLSSEIETLELWTHEDYFLKVVSFFSRRRRR